MPKTLEAFQVHAYETVSGREVHMCGTNVGVVFEMHSTSETLYNSRGAPYVVPLRVRNQPARPYIDFVHLVRVGEGWVESTTNVGDGRLSAEQATQLVTELLRAVEYIQSRGWEAE